MRDVGPQHFLATVRGALPEHAELTVHSENGDICIEGDWQLGNEPVRPNKRSRKILVRITRSAVDDYAASEDRNRVRADGRLQNHISAILRSFNPNHDSPAHVSPPIEEWVVTTEMLNT